MHIFFNMFPPTPLEQFEIKSQVLAFGKNHLGCEESCQLVDNMYNKKYLQHT